MLDQNDLQLLRSMMQEVVGDSEARMTAKIEGVESRLNARIDDVEARLNARIDDVEARLNARIDDVEARLNARIDDVEARLTDCIAASESKIIAYIESDVMPRFDILADGHKLLNETLAPISRVEKVEEEVAFLKPLVMSTFADVEKLKKAQ